MKKRLVCILLPLLLLFPALFSCRQKEAKLPVTQVTLGMTFEEAAACEPSLSADERGRYTCPKTYAGVEGGLLVGFSSTGDVKTVNSILWSADPTDGNGKAVYDELFASLGNTFGKLKTAQDNQGVESFTGVLDEAKAQWEKDDFVVSCFYIEYHESGYCQIQTKLQKKTNG